MKLHDRVTWITGAAGGIGLALAQRFVTEGVRGVGLVDRDERVLEAASTLGERALGAVADVTDEVALVATLEATEERFGPIDLVVSNAGIGIPGGVEVPDEGWRRIWDINLMAHIYAARWAVPRMIERGGGYLLNTASAAGLLSQIGSAPYAVTKHAAVALAEWLSITHGDQGIRVSVLCPQAVRTAMTAHTEQGGVAGVDGMIEPEAVAEAVVQALAEERFLVLPHPQVQEYMRRKTADYDRWLGGMRRLQQRVQVGELP
ncbi:MAG TPA: SDR family oxidoreductase [Thermoanaerobaculia bacterium]|nr:SDR family oxidoreductase [Thermoanaerobaculia bacterium]